MDVSWKIVARGIVSPEGPAANEQGEIFLVSRWIGRILKVDGTGKTSELAHTGGKPQSVALLPSGDLLVPDAKNRTLYRLTRDGQLMTICDHVESQPLLGPNDLLIGPNNVVYLTDPGNDLETPGQVLRVDLNNGAAAVLTEGLFFPNGIALSDDAQTLYVAESAYRRVWRFPLIDQGRRLGTGEVFHQFDDFYPDGMALDITGRLIVALHGGGILAVLSPSGEYTDSIPTGGRGCTNCVFGGSNFQILFVTEDDQQALICTRWDCPGQRNFSRSLSS